MTKTTSKSMQMTPLPNDYIPGEYDVICAKGKAAKSSSGNMFYHKLIQRALPVYKDASTKFEKSMIVSEIVDEIRSRSSTGTTSKSTSNRINIQHQQLLLFTR